MKGLSKKEVEVIAKLEFERMYYFTTKYIGSYFQNKKQLFNFIYNLRKKGRIVKINRNKYFLVPIKATTGKWVDNPVIIADEICNSKDYFINGWYAAHYWHLSDQIPMQIDIWTTRRQGKVKLLNVRFVFHRTTRRWINKVSIKRKMEGHEFRIMNKEESKKWMKSRR